MIVLTKANRVQIRPVKRYFETLTWKNQVFFQLQ